MKRIFTFLAAVCLLGTAQAQTPITIAAARALGPGATVTVSGIVTNGPELGVIRYFQDSTGGLSGYSTSSSLPPNNTAFSSLMPGDSIIISGVLKNFNHLLELDPVTAVTVVTTGKPLPAPVVFTPATMSLAFSEQYEGMLIRINGNTSITSTAGAPFATFAGNTNYRLNGNATSELRVNSASTGPNGIVGKPSPTGNFDVVGIMSQFHATNPAAGYQFLPRVYSDFILSGAPNIISALIPKNITTSSFTVNFNTLNAGDSKIEYGTTMALGQQVTNAISTNSHSVNLSGLQPATVYYVKATSTNAIGSSSSGIIPMMTASNSSGVMRAYFNKSVNTTFAMPGNAAITLTNTFADTIAAYINRAQHSVDVTIYSWDNTTILNAINAAYARGVVVRVIYDGAPAGTNFMVSQLNPGIPKVAETSSSSIMHNKFVVIDANATNPNLPYILTGSTNWSPGQLNNDPNNIIFIQDQSVARTFKMEFDEMWGSTTTTPGTPKFGAAKTDNTPHFFNVGGSLVEVYFSPSDNVNTRIIDAIATADNDLHIGTMLITRSDLAIAIRDAVTKNNNAILNCSDVLVNDTTTTGAAGPFQTIRNAMGNRAQVFNRPGIFHHKYMLVDVGDGTSDPMVLTGSHNWSNAANTRNDENTVIIHNQAIANLYYQEYAQRMQEQNNNVTLCNFAITGNSENLAVVSKAVVYPNPNSGTFRVKLSDNSIKTANVILFDMTGKKVFEKAYNADNEISVEVENLPKGIYNMQLTNRNTTQYNKVVIY